MRPRARRDSVAWHGDRISKEIPDPIVALVSVGKQWRLIHDGGAPKGGEERAICARLHCVTGNMRDYALCVSRMVRKVTEVLLPFVSCQASVCNYASPSSPRIQVKIPTEDTGR
jgi:hypothetical protein